MSKVPGTADLRLAAVTRSLGHTIVPGSEIGNPGTAKCSCGESFPTADGGGWYVHQAEVVLAAADAVDPLRHPPSGDADEKRVEAVANQLRSQFNDFESPDILMRKRARMVLRAADWSDGCQGVRRGSADV